MTSEIDDSTIIDDEPNMVRDGDVILIETAHHSYKFAVTDSHNKRGLLMGGTFGERGLTATSGSLIEQGYGARFDVGFAGSVGRMVTSDVTDLVCIREGHSVSTHAIKFPSAIQLSNDDQLARGILNR
jgi:hypothetical protein